MLVCCGGVLNDLDGRPDTTICLLHPFFWDQGRRLTFLQDASDRFEIMCRDPRDPLLVTLETGAYDIVGNDWHTRLDKIFIDNLGKFRKYDGRSVQDLLRALRNKVRFLSHIISTSSNHTAIETPLSRPPRQCEATFGAHARRFLVLFHKTIPALVFACAWRCIRYHSPTRVHVPFVF